MRLRHAYEIFPTSFRSRDRIPLHQQFPQCVEGYHQVSSSRMCFTSLHVNCQRHTHATHNHRPHLTQSTSPAHQIDVITKHRLSSRTCCAATWAAVHRLTSA